ncbi:MAG TPA: hypothetical protein VEL07_22845 [Planctomycetota bacterium]|nr:hypothetical protein [Planctomycetota bacterium]
MNPLTLLPAGRRRYPSASARLISYYDGKGHKRTATRDEWRRDILPHALERAGSDPARLERVVAGALAHGCASEVVVAAERLAVLDPERGPRVHARALIAIGELDRAEKVLLDRLGRSGADAGALSELARIYDARGDATRADELQWQALKLAPNDAESLAWWGSRHEDGLARAATLPGAWRPQVSLAARALANGDTDGAIAQYRAVSERLLAHPEGLRQVAEDLVRAGQHRAALDLVHPLYDPQFHGPWTGLALLQACTECRELTTGRALLHTLFVNHRHELRDHLQTSANRFLALTDAPPTAEAVSESTPVELSVVPVECPVWWSFLRQPGWLRPVRPADAPLVAFAALAHRGDGAARGWARSIPLALAETFAFRCSADAIALVAVDIAGAAPALADLAQPWTADEAFAFARQGERFADFVVTGEVVEGAGRCEITLTVYDAARRLTLGVLTRTGSSTAVGAMLRTLEAELAQTLHLPMGDDQLGVYASPHPSAAADRLIALELLMRLHLAEHGVIAGPRLLERCALIDACARLVEHGSATALDRLLLLAAIAADAASGSQMYREHHDMALTMVEEDDEPRSPFRRASPLMLWLFDQQRDFRVRRDELLAESADPAYREWLARLGEEAAQLIVIGDDL